MDIGNTQYGLTYVTTAGSRRWHGPYPGTEILIETLNVRRLAEQQRRDVKAFSYGAEYGSEPGPIASMEYSRIDQHSISIFIWTEDAAARERMFADVADAAARVARENAMLREQLDAATTLGARLSLELQEARWGIEQRDAQIRAHAEARAAAAWELRRAYDVAAEHLEVARCRAEDARDALDDRDRYRQQAIESARERDTALTAVSAWQTATADMQSERDAMRQELAAEVARRQEALERLGRELGAHERTREALKTVRARVEKMERGLADAAGDADVSRMRLEQVWPVLRRLAAKDEAPSAAVLSLLDGLPVNVQRAIREDETPERLLARAWQDDDGLLPDAREDISGAIDNAHAALRAIETGARERDVTVLKLARGVLAQNDALRRQERRAWRLRAELALAPERAAAVAATSSAIGDVVYVLRAVTDLQQHGPAKEQDVLTRARELGATDPARALDEALQWGHLVIVTLDEFEHRGFWTARGYESHIDVMQVFPLDMVLYCPACGHQHVDAPEPETGWRNPVHKSHRCGECLTVWRPADMPTNGVQAIKTRGKQDTWNGQATDLAAAAAARGRAAARAIHAANERAAASAAAYIDADSMRRAGTAASILAKALRRAWTPEAADIQILAEAAAVALALNDEMLAAAQKRNAHLERCLSYRNVALDALGWAFTASDGNAHQRPGAARPSASTVAIGLTGLAAMLDLLVEVGAAGLRQSELPRRMREMAGLLQEGRGPGDEGHLALGVALRAVEAILRSVRPEDQPVIGASAGVVELLAHALVLPVREAAATPERVARALVQRFGPEQRGAVARGLLAVAVALRSAR